jgi:hypothetical protein
LKPRAGFICLDVSGKKFSRHSSRDKRNFSASSVETRTVSHEAAFAIEPALPAGFRGHPSAGRVAGPHSVQVRLKGHINCSVFSGLDQLQLQENGNQIKTLQFICVV